jgi:hypothetical protein
MKNEGSLANPGKAARRSKLIFLAIESIVPSGSDDSLLKKLGTFRAV